MPAVAVAMLTINTYTKPRYKRPPRVIREYWLEVSTFDFTLSTTRARSTLDARQLCMVNDWIMFERRISDPGYQAFQS